MVTMLFALPTNASTDPASDSDGSVWSSWARSALDGAPDWVQDLAGSALGIGAALIGALIMWIVGRLAIRTVTRGIESGTPLSRRARRALERTRIDIPPVDPQELRLAATRRRQRANTIGAVLRSALAVIIAAVLVVMALDMIGLPVAPLLASAGIVGVAFGFGAQSLVKDLLSGLFMLIEDQYGVGDVVDLGAATGTVEEVGLRSTRLRSLDGTVWYIPNGEILRVGNMTRLWSRALIEVRLGIETDLDDARQAMLDAVAAARAADPDVDGAILSDPEVPGIESFDYYSVSVRLLIQCVPVKQWAVMRAVRLEMRRIFAERGIRLAVPDQTLIMGTPAPQDILAQQTSDDEDDAS